MAAPTISADVSTDFNAPGGVTSAGSLTIGSGTKAVIGVINGGASTLLAGPVTVGGVTMALLEDTSGALLCFLDDLSAVGTGSKAILVNFNGGAYRAASTFYALDHADPLEVRDSTFVSGEGFPGPVSASLSGDTTDALGFGAAHNDGFFTGAIDLGPDLVEDHSHNIASVRVKTFHDPTSPATAHASNHSASGTLKLVFGMVGPVASPDREFTASPFGAEAGFQAGVSFGPGADVDLFAQRFGVEAGFVPGILLGVAAARQVMLVGGDIETPEMTEGGTEGYVLTFHEDSKPTWEPGSGPGSLALDDLSDVDAPTPSDGDVLTFDSGSGDWVNAAPVTGGGVEVKEVDGSPDVNPTTILRFPNGSLTNDGGGQVTVAFPSVTGYIPESLMDAKGDLIVATADNTPARLAVGGTNGHVLTVDSGEATGVKWAAPGGSSASGGGGWFGDANDGSATLDGSTAVTGCSRSGNDYTAQRDLYFADLTVNSGKTLDMAGFVLHVRGTLTNSGTIFRKPVPATGSRTGATGFTAGRTGMSGGGGTGPVSTGNGSAGTNATTPALGGAGGAGGASQGGGGSGGAGGTASPGTTAVGQYWRTLPDAATGWSTLSAARFNGGAGGGGGGTNGALGNGGGGGAGGGILIIRANVIDNSSGLIHADGGAGSNGSDNVNDGGGGGGGGGGAVLLVYNTFTAGGGTVRAAGGAFGTSPAGTNGTAGSAGTVSYIDLTV